MLQKRTPVAVRSYWPSFSRLANHRPIKRLSWIRAFARQTGTFGGRCQKPPRSARTGLCRTSVDRPPSGDHGAADSRGEGHCSRRRDADTQDPGARLDACCYFPATIPRYPDTVAGPPPSPISPAGFATDPISRLPRAFPCGVFFERRLRKSRTTHWFKAVHGSPDARWRVCSCRQRPRHAAVSTKRLGRGRRLPGNPDSTGPGRSSRNRSGPCSP